jgi:hypothetical protein
MNVNDIKLAILLCRNAGITSFLWGHRGLGKSALHMQAARERGWGFINLRCSQMEASDLRGLPDKTDDGFTVYRPPADLPAGHGDDIKCPACDVDMTIEQAQEQGIDDYQYCKGLLFLDELNRGEDDVLQAGFELVLDYKVGLYRVPKGWSVHCAGNYMDGYMVNNFSDPAFLDRFCHMQITNSESYRQGWAEYMGRYEDTANKILQFVAFNQKHLMGDVKGDMGFTVQPSPRSWEFVAKVEEACQKEKFPTQVKRTVIAGIIGQSMALQYEQFTCEVTPQDIMQGGLAANKRKIQNLHRNALVGLIWGLSANCKQTKKTKKMMTNVIDFMEFLAQKSERDLAVSLGRSLCENESTDLAGAMLSNPKLAALASRWKQRNAKKGELSWIKEINDREDLQELMSKVSFGMSV